MKAMTNIAVMLAIAGAGLMMLAGCSRFEKDWRAAAISNATGANRSPAGRWAGTWKSDVNAHTDELRCLIRPLTNDVFEARYHARYRRGLLRFTFQYTVPLTVTATERDGSWQFAGEADLGWLAGGLYRYTGGVTNGLFHSRYDSRYDRGWFEMRRAPATK